MIRKVVIEKFVATDGSEFENEIDAIAYENLEFLMYGVFSELGNSGSGKTRHKAAMMVLKNLQNIFDHFNTAGLIKLPVSETATPDETPIEVPTKAIETPVEEVPIAAPVMKVKKERKPARPKLPYGRDEVVDVLNSIKETGFHYRSDVIETLTERKMVVPIEDGKFKISSGGAGYLSISEHQKKKALEAA